ncbi:hypothetical protein [Streptomyces sp. NPDC014623]|uniref:hypothetical protein n=1 Tax=Streptomyces sp. NPDC014623 TaxID=3364875 RepID=UPI0036F943BD
MTHLRTERTRARTPLRAFAPAALPLPAAPGGAVAATGARTDAASGRAVAGAGGTGGTGHDRCSGTKRRDPAAGNCAHARLHGIRPRAQAVGGDPLRTYGNRARVRREDGRREQLPPGRTAPLPGRRRVRTG